MVGTNIYKEVAFLKPSVGNSAPETPYILKVAETEIKKAFRKEIRRNLATSNGKSPKTSEVLLIYEAFAYLSKVYLSNPAFYRRICAKNINIC